MPKITKESGLAPKVGFVSLGCAKALVDSERIMTRLRAEGYAIAPSYEGAGVVVVNTCGFLDSAKAESLEAKKLKFDQASTFSQVPNFRRARLLSR